MGTKLENAVAILNGVVGDYLNRTGNGLATEMTFRDRAEDGNVVALDRSALLQALGSARRVCVLVHGLMSTEVVWRFDGADYGTLLERDFGLHPLYVRYNSGLPIADNGALLARALEQLVTSVPEIVEIVPIGHSMGGLVVRSACHVATLEGHRWLSRVHRAFYVGTPHLGAPLERVGRLVSKVLRTVPDPVTLLLADIADLRSDGVKDLGDADIRHEDRAALTSRLTLRDAKHPVPLLPSIRHHLVAGTLSTDPRLAAFFGDAIVPLPSASDGRLRGANLLLPQADVKLFPGMHHIDIAHHPDVYACLSAWCAGEGARAS